MTTENKIKYYGGRIPACGVFCGGCPMYLKDKNPCPGAEINQARCEKCKTFHLCCREHNITHCFQCKIFPCYKFKRFAKNWLKYGQDMIENQLFLEKNGEDKFQKFFNDKIIIETENKIKYFESREDWRKWLTDNFETANEIWFVFPPNKSLGKKSILYNDVVEEAPLFRLD
jgi:hypothetical protein